MDVIVLSVAFDQFSSEIKENLVEDALQVTDGRFGEHVPAVFCDKYQMDMQHVNNMSASSVIHARKSRTNY